MGILELATRHRRTLLIALVALGAIALLAQALHILHDPAFVFLRSQAGANWIRYDEPTYLKAWNAGTLLTQFRHSFTVDRAPNTAPMAVRALRWATVTLDGQPLFETNRDMSQWKRAVRFDLAPHLTPGTHELLITVINENGPALLLAHCPALGLRTGPEWEASTDKQSWRAAARTVPRIPELAEQFGPVHRAFLKHSLFFLLLFLFTAGLAWWAGARGKNLDPSWVRWLLLAAWILLGANNIAKIPPHVGMDIKEHVKYIQYVAETWRVPLATEGWQMFQSPLYYFLSAPLYLLFSLFWEADGVTKALRIIPLICGALQVELSFRATRYAFPTRKDLQVLGTTLGGLMPMNLYLAQVVGNEPLCSLWSGAVLLLLVRVLSQEDRAPGWRISMAIGLCLGLSLLSKVTALLLVPFVAVALLYAATADKNRTPGRLLRAMALALALVAAVAGWYYLRNWILLGRPFIGGWDAHRTITWWQDPGYRTPEQLFRFGTALHHPIYAAVQSFADSVYATLWLDGSLSGIMLYSYRPPWNYGLMLSCAWLAILPTAAIVLGIVQALRTPKAVQLLGAACLGLYGLALLHHFCMVPFYSSAKASYMGGLTVLLAILGAQGFDCLTRNRYVRIAVYGLFACWATAAYAAYFVR